MTDPEPFAEDRWEHSLAEAIEEHEVDQLSGIDSMALAEHLALVSNSLTKLVKERDRGMPGALDAVERAELAQLRKVAKSQEVWLAQKEDALAERERAVINLEILLKDAYAQRDRALAELKKASTAAWDWDKNPPGWSTGPIGGSWSGGGQREESSAKVDETAGRPDTGGSDEAHQPDDEGRTGEGLG